MQRMAVAIISILAAKVPVPISCYIIFSIFPKISVPQMLVSLSANLLIQAVFNIVEFQVDQRF